MAIEFKVDFSQLEKLIETMKKYPDRLKKSLAGGLNKYTAEIVELIIQEYARQTGQNESDARAQITIDRATPDDLTTQIEQLAAFGWASPGEVSAGTLVKIVTTEDERVCEICQNAAEDSPYTVAEINRLREKWKHFHGAPGFTRTNLIHPNCRCVLQPWRTRDQTTGKIRQGPTSPDLFRSRSFKNPT